MAKLKDITGHRFGKLTVISRCGRDIHGRVTWNCECDCGSKKVCSGYYLNSGTVKSCGCLVSSTIIDSMIGKRFGKLIVVSFHGINEYRSYMWNCECDCGNTPVCNGANLRGGKTRSCGCVSKSLRNDLTGKRFGMLVVLHRVDNIDRFVAYMCECDCGNNHIVTSSHLTVGSTKSCGCNSGKLSHGESSFNRLYATYNNNIRGIPFDISKTIFRCMVECNCYYCDRSPYSIISRTYSDTNGTFTYNGLDRVDSKKGYTIDNVVTCCKECNLAKRDMNHDQFISICKLIAENHKE